MKPYQVVYADPPWPCPGGFAPNIDYASSFHYECMKASDIVNLRVVDIVADDAALFLWVTARDLPLAIEQVIPSWGFKYQTKAFNWLKLTTKGNPVKVMGRYFFSSTEDCLFCVRGKVSNIWAGMSTKVDSLIQEQRVRHSQKPEAAYDRIERLFPNTRRIELFSRNRRNGWDAWGNEVADNRSVSRILMGRR